MSLPRYPNYKDSRVEWLGEVPGHWDLKPLWTFFRRVKRTGFETEQLLSVYRDHGVILKASRDDNFNKPSDDLSVYQLVIPGDLAINKMKAWQGSVAISDYRGIVSPAYFVYEALHTANSRYLHYLMRSLRYITGYLSVSKGIRVNQWDLEPQLHSRMPLTVPPIVEQTQIAAFLDRETAKIDELVAEQRRLMELLKEKRQAVISHAVTRGLNPDVPLKPSGIEWLGDVPEHWSVSKVKHLCYVNDGNHGEEYPKESDYTNEVDGVPFIRGGNLSRLTISPENMLYITREKNDSMRKGNVKVNDVLFVNRGEIGKLAIIPTEFAGANLNSQIAYLRSNEMLYCRFLLYFLGSTHLQSLLESMKAGSVLTQFPIRDINELFVVLPAIDEQHDIAAWLDLEAEKFDTLTAEAQRAIDLLQERRTALISAAVTGQIDVRGAVAA